ncbi:MAG: hypothetical protein COA50_00260 [Flavobacteriaceae bacterium]|nr:MAG: hypothetical protein COA50_00260 [Flavobacteriaceae bacterium]
MPKKWNTYHTRGIKKKYLYRFMDKEKLVDLLSSKSLYLTRMDRFKDNLEGIKTYDITELINHYQDYFHFPISDKNPDLTDFDFNYLKESARESLLQQREILKKVQNAHFVSCWFNSEKESHAMWSYYAGKGGFAIRFERKEFQKNIKQSLLLNAPDDEQFVIVGRIKYQDFKNVIFNEEESQVKYLAFRKDNSFEHEKEYRVVMLDTSSSEQEDHKRYQITSFNELDITIIVDPEIDDDSFVQFKTELEGLGGNISVVRSELEPFYQFKKRTERL